MASQFVERVAVEAGVVPIDATGAAQAGDWVSMKNYQKLMIVILQGAWAAGTPAVTLDQATVVAGTDTKDLGFTTMWTKGSTGTFTKTAVVSDTFNLTNGANRVTVIEVDASSLDADNDFDCVQVDIGTPGSNADLIAVTYFLYEPRFAQALPPDPKVD